MAENVYCPPHRASNAKFRKGWDSVFATGKSNYRVKKKPAKPGPEPYTEKDWDDLRYATAKPYRGDNPKTPWEEGCKAFRDGLWIENCPYEMETDEYEEWKDGYWTAR